MQTESARPLQVASSGPFRRWFPIAVCALLSAWSAPVLAEEWEGKVVGVADGDTITVLHDQTPTKIRLEAVDAPEKAQPFGTRAKEFTSARVFDQLVRVKVVTRDKYGRTVAWVYYRPLMHVWGKGGLADHPHTRRGPERCLNEELLQAGLAWHYVKYDKSKALQALEDTARAEKRGLWADPTPTAPWKWRHGEKDTGKASVPAEIACQQDRDCVLDFSVTLTDPRDHCSCGRCGRHLPRVVNKEFAPRPSSKPCAPRSCPTCLVQPPPPLKVVCQDGRCSILEARSPAASGPLHGNTMAKRFHRPGCRDYNCKHCTAVFQSREEALKAGYKPCGTCKP